jgi:mannobiose 2-epimerase
MTDAAAPSMQDLDSHISRLEQALENIVSFWFPRCIDERNGGYHLNFGTHGEDLGPAPKMVITQARMVWLFSRLAREGYRTAEMLEAAEHGYRFLTERMQDMKYGGYYWLTRVDGSPRRMRKHLCGQSFVLYGFAEYAAVTGHNEALAAAEALFELTEERAHDVDHGGYSEAFSRKWGRPLPWHVGSGASRYKSVNTHLHHMEALSAYCRLNPASLVRERLLELIGIETSNVFAAFGEASTNLFESDWTPVLEKPEARYSYGHDLENIWLTVEACVTAGIPVDLHLPLFRRVFDTCLGLGFDHEGGGFYFSGLPGNFADDRNKVWWVQAEAMVSALAMHRLTSDRRYYEVFEKTWHFVDRHMIDWQDGEWFHTITPDGTPEGPKASEWKAGYHTGRAVLECLHLLRALRANPSPSPLPVDGEGEREAKSGS